ncbi:hypothetical protein EDB81DRAFT_753960 [Dactylonectria macrodidyma]|uniref:Uncharacterized protein n=1 Tax=Dactylonectria macrodidyma TaxID=307937 RepID=A0A9P9FML3_9HYPO|nr:hypothetical protein EDB81DRAFT_753960 [Dactylonectria macrodidyma]
MAYTGLVILLLVAFVARANSNTTFTSPGPYKSSQDSSQYPTYKIGQRIDVQWESSNATSFDLYLAMSHPSYYALQLTNQSKSGEFEWTVSLDDIKTSIPKSDDYVLGFGLYSWDRTGRRNPEPVLSEFFNVSAPDNGLSTGAVAGIAVGSTIVGLLVVGGLAFLAWRSFRGLKGFRAWKDSQHVEAGPEISQSQPESLPPQYRPPGAPHEQLVQNSPTALLGHNGSERKSELPGTNVIYGPETRHSLQRHQGVYEAP